MILDKYQIQGQKKERGYSFTAIVIDNFDKQYFAKWIKGIDKNSQPGKLFMDKLRSLKKIKSDFIPEIIEYGFDNSEKSYCIIYQYLTYKPLTEINDLHPVYFLKGILQIAKTLQEIQQHNIFHEDIHPDNILVDNNNNFYLIDLGLSRITTTLSQAQNLEIFAKDFAAPEKWNTKIEKGFPFQSDIYSIGKVISWYFERTQENQAITDFINLLCKEKPSERLNYNQLIDSLNKIVQKFAEYFERENNVFISFKNNHTYNSYFLTEIAPAIFDINPKEGGNVLMNIATDNYLASGLWLIQDKELKILNIEHKQEIKDERWNRSRKFGKKLDFQINFIQRTRLIYRIQTLDLTPYFRNILKQKNLEYDYRKGKQNINKELDFFTEILNKEKEVLEKNSLRLKYKKFEKKSTYDIWFFIVENEKYSRIDTILNHIDIATDPKNDEFEYILSPIADKKQIKEPVKFVGVAYDWDSEEKILKLKDCEYLNFECIPSNGYLFENIAQQEAEKNRQLEAIQKVRHNEVQSRELIHYIFNPTELKGGFLEHDELNDIFQTDDKGNKFTYSFNQQKSILNALYRKPLTVVQGPPGTGKTTVITEIVFQLLSANPDAKILITSQTNDAVDNVLDNLLKKDIPFVRLSGIREPRMQSLKKHTLNRKIEGWKIETGNKSKSNYGQLKRQFFDELSSENPLFQSFVDILLKDTDWKTKRNQLEKLIERLNQFNSLLSNVNNELEFINAFSQVAKTDIKRFFKLKDIHYDWLAAINSLDENSTVNQKLIDAIRVIGATCNHIAAKKYSKYNFEFDYVIMDEAGKATTAEALVPIIFGNNLIFVGDHRQLRPMLTSNREVEKWLREKFKQEGEILEFDSWDDYFNRPSLFEQIITSIEDDFKSQLTECRRSSAEQVLMTSKCFYEPFGDEPIEPVTRPEEKEHNLDLKINSSILFFDIGHSYRSEKDNGGSSYNNQSIKFISELLKKLDEIEKIKNYSVGVITGYKAQLRKLKNEIQKLKFKNIKTNSSQFAISVVDRFQGLEKDIIIFDLVRTGHDNNLGFLADEHRINVALSRQKRLLIIVGDYNGLLNAKSPRPNEADTKLQLYLRLLKSELKTNCIVTNINQVF
ncbi:MAG: protein kinase [Chitinophagaceae bacterium]|nr:protein kinase [Chitinophagaceae bacterium]MBP9135763.1 protein kinase [Chitinophagales bacterium]